MALIKHADWEAKGQALFGPDMEKWVFVCPSCGHAISLEKARAEFPELKGCGWSPGQECLGRHSPKVVQKDGTRCDWAAYGLFRGPDIVVLADGKEIAVFEFAQPQERAAAPAERVG